MNKIHGNVISCPCGTDFYDGNQPTAVCPSCKRANVSLLVKSKQSTASNTNSKPKQGKEPEINSRMTTEQVIRIICDDQRPTGNFIQTMGTFFTGRVVIPFAKDWKNIKISKNEDWQMRRKRVDYLDFSNVDYNKLLNRYIRPKIDIKNIGTKEGKEKAQKKLDRLYWGHLVIDEGQDFPPDLYLFLYNVMDLFLMNDTKRRNMSISIFADEHQRLEQSSNSTIKDIREALEVPRTHIYKLEDNYRNTKQIYDFAIEFSGQITSDECKITNKKKGDLPRVYLTDEQNNTRAHDILFERLANQIINIGSGNSIGIITCDSNHRLDLFEDLQNQDDITDNFTIQTYSSDPEEEHSERTMIFGEGESVISVLHSKSCKGLEFDHVFLWRLDAMDTSSAQQLNLDNTLYVMICRARRDVILFLKSGSILLKQRLQTCIDKKLCEFKRL